MTLIKVFPQKKYGDTERDTHRLHECRLSIGNQHKDVSVETMTVDPGVHVRRQVNARTEGNKRSHSHRGCWTLVIAVITISVYTSFIVSYIWKLIPSTKTYGNQENLLNLIK